MKNNFLKNLKIVHEKILELKDAHEDFFKNISFGINVDKSSFGNTFAKVPGGNTIKSFIMDFRPFLLQNEYLYFPSLCKDIERNLKNADLIYNTQKFRKVWNKFYKDTQVGGLNTKINNKPMTVGRRIDLWLNGKFMHPTDKKKQKHRELKEITETPFGIMDYVLFIDILQRLATLIIMFDENIIIKILGKDKNN